MRGTTSNWRFLWQRSSDEESISMSRFSSCVSQALAGSACYTSIYFCPPFNLPAHINGLPMFSAATPHTITQYQQACHRLPDSKVHGANMGPIWDQQDPGGPHVGPMNFAIWAIIHAGQKCWQAIVSRQYTNHSELSCFTCLVAFFLTAARVLNMVKW